MRDIKTLSVDLENFSQKVVTKLIEAQNKTAKSVWEDTISLAPFKSGNYISSIKVKEAELKNGNISAEVYTDLTSRVHSGEEHVVGRMIEHGTGIYAEEPHIGSSELFIKSGYRYWMYPDENGELVIGTAQPAQPHFKPAVDRNWDNWRANISEAIKEARK